MRLPFQNSGLSTVSRARSHIFPSHSTLARHFWDLPGRRTCTVVALDTCRRTSRLMQAEKLPAGYASYKGPLKTAQRAGLKHVQWSAEALTRLSLRKYAYHVCVGHDMPLLHINNEGRSSARSLRTHLPRLQGQLKGLARCSSG